MSMKNDKESRTITAVVNSKSGLNLRKSPDKEGEVVSVLKDGTEVNLTKTEKYKEWAFVTCNADGFVSGYVMTKYLKF